MRRQGFISRQVWRPSGETGFCWPRCRKTKGAGATVTYQLVVQDELARAEVPTITEGLQAQIEQERKRADQGVALRKYRYGVDKDDG